jgi:hypothetical protein
MLDARILVRPTRAIPGETTRLEMAPDPWLEATAQHVTYTIMADVGGVYAWLRFADEAHFPLGTHCGDVRDGWFGEHRISAETEQALAQWQARFENDAQADGGTFDWNAFHADGIALAAQVKQEIRTRARVVYQKAMQDPRHRDAERQEISLEGTLVRLPNRAQADPLPLRVLVRRVVSGGEAGVDRAALDWAIDHRVDHGGWCPRGRRADDGPLDARYVLHETDSTSDADRTRRNVREGDATLILNAGLLEGHALLCQRLAQAAGKPCLVAQLDDRHRARELRRVLEWLGSDALLTLHVAGPRAASRPGIHALAYTMLGQLDRPELTFPVPVRL